jgi:predicted transcriptional regulator
MNTHPDYLEMERKLAELGIPHEKFLAEAGITQSTWWRWREGKFEPRISKWRNVESAFDRLTAKGA